MLGAPTINTITTECIFAHAVGVEVMWEMELGMRAYITLQSQWQGQVTGLCGDFDGLASNDYRARTGQIETTSAAFANRYSIISIIYTS